MPLSSLYDWTFTEWSSKHFLVLVIHVPKFFSVFESFLYAPPAEKLFWNGMSTNGESFIPYVFYLKKKHTVNIFFLIEQFVEQTGALIMVV